MARSRNCFRSFFHPGGDKGVGSADVEKQVQAECGESYLSYARLRTGLPKSNRGDGISISGKCIQVWPTNESYTPL